MSIRNTFVWFNPQYLALCLAFKKFLSNAYSLLVHSLILHKKCKGEKKPTMEHIQHQERDEAMVKELEEE